MPEIVWIESTPEFTEAARFFAANISPDPSYISHGEIQGGLSPDGRSWAPDLEARFIEDLADKDDTQAVAVLRDEGGAILAAALVDWIETPRVRFGVLEDLAVPPALRSSGLGGRMVEFVEAEARKRGCRWLFLESGKHNHRAHAFFARHGFEEISHVFAKRIG